MIKILKQEILVLPSNKFKEKERKGLIVSLLNNKKKHKECEKYFLNIHSKAHFIKVNNIEDLYLIGRYDPVFILADSELSDDYKILLKEVLKGFRFNLVISETSLKSFRELGFPILIDDFFPTTYWAVYFLIKTFFEFTIDCFYTGDVIDLFKNRIFYFDFFPRMKRYHKILPLVYRKRGFSDTGFILFEVDPKEDDFKFFHKIKIFSNLFLESGEYSKYSSEGYLYTGHRESIFQGVGVFSGFDY